MIGLVATYFIGKDVARKQADRATTNTQPTTFGNVVGAVLALGVVLVVTVIVTPVWVVWLGVIGWLAQRRGDITRWQLKGQSAALAVPLGAWVGALVGWLALDAWGWGALVGATLGLGVLTYVTVRYLAHTLRFSFQLA